MMGSHEVLLHVHHRKSIQDGFSPGRCGRAGGEVGETECCVIVIIVGVVAAGDTLYGCGCW